MFELEKTDKIKEILLKYSKVVVLGCSRNPSKDAHAVPKYLIERGYEVYCVNPFAEQNILGRPTFKSLAEVPKEFFEILVVFRPSKEVPGIVEELIKLGKIPKVLWLQEGIKHESAKKLEEFGATVVQDRCIRKEYARVFVERDEVYERILRFARAYAKVKGLRLNPDPEKLDAIIKALAENEKRYSYRFCPCRTITGNFEEDKDKICPCKWHMEEIEKQGHCHCGLFWATSA